MGGNRSVHNYKCRAQDRIGTTQPPGVFFNQRAQNRNDVGSPSWAVYSTRPAQGAVPATVLSSSSTSRGPSSATAYNNNRIVASAFYGKGAAAPEVVLRPTAYFPASTQPSPVPPSHFPADRTGKHEQQAR